MNLVAKEFAAARGGEQWLSPLEPFYAGGTGVAGCAGCEPLSQGAVGRSRSSGLGDDSEEKQLRIARMRRLIREHPIYCWTADLISELAEFRRNAPGSNDLEEGGNDAEARITTIREALVVYRAVAAAGTSNALSRLQPQAKNQTSQVDEMWERRHGRATGVFRTGWASPKLG
jgi:hypothetical protein